MCNCPGKETEGAISEYTCPSCGLKWIRDENGVWIEKRAQDLEDRLHVGLPMTPEDQDADREAGRYHDDLVKSWNLF